MHHPSARRPATTLVALLVAMSVAWLLPAVSAYAVVEVPTIVQDTVGFERAPGLRAASAGSVLARESDVVEPAADFSMVAAQAPEGAVVEVAVRNPDGSWQAYQQLPPGQDHRADEDEQDPDTPGMHWTEPVFVDHGTALKVRVTGADPASVTATVMDAHGRSGAASTKVRVPAAQALAQEADATGAGVPRPEIVSRQMWGANSPREDIKYATAEWYRDDYESPDPYVDPGRQNDLVGAGVMHHTAGSNAYSADEVSGIIRGIQRFHQDSRGWNDIGYNFLVDRFGRIWEGRAGGVDRAVIGAHAGGWNTSSFGVAVMGNFTNGNAVPGASMNAAVELLAWKFDLHGIDPIGRHTWPNGGTRPTLIGHTDVTSTACPGDIHDLLPQLRERVAQAMFVEPEPVDEGPFLDVDPQGVHAEAIFQLYEQGAALACRDGHYCPSRAATRADVAGIVARGLGLIPISGESDFSDVSPKDLEAPWITALSRAGYINGYGDGTFRPSDQVTRAEAAAILGRSIGLRPLRFDMFDDVDPLSPFSPWIHALLEVEVTRGCGEGVYCPASSVNRGEMASFVLRGIAVRG